MKHYNQPIVTLIYYGQNDVICASDEYVESGAPLKDNDVKWGGTW